MFQFKSHCHCGNIEAEILLSEKAESYAPRACDCDFCRQHGAAYISDCNGRLAFHVRDKQALSHYRQGSEQAEFLICQNCGVLAGVIYHENHQTYGVLNSRMLLPQVQFTKINKVSPRLLSAEEKTRRWKEVWFANVTID